ncbi:MAG TPA: Fe-S cluster assembly protein SufB, partial [Planctomycetota bacterium]|nr:Fe-S cluster assembly protein SufB [Planctomycetota bacterium]
MTDIRREPSATESTVNPAAEIVSDYKFGFHEKEKHAFRTDKGLTRKTVEDISAHKNEPKWMLDFRLRALDIFFKKPTPTWCGDLSGIDYDNITYYLKPTDEKFSNWDMVPEDIKRTYDKLGIPEDERKFLGGVGAQYDSEVVYHNLKKEWEDKGVIFVSPEEAVEKHP